MLLQNSDSSFPCFLFLPCVPAGLHGRAGVQGPVPRGGRDGGAAGPLEPPGGEEYHPAGGGGAEGQSQGFSGPADG